MWAYEQAYQRWRLSRARVAEKRGDVTRPKNEREWRFCAFFAKGMMERAMANEGKLTFADRVRVAREAATAAGYPEKNEYALTRRGIAQAALPRTQQGVADILAAQGVDVAACGAVLAEVMEYGEPADKLKAVELFFKTTVGFAPTKSAMLHGSVGPDALFDPKEFEKTPPIKTVGATVQPGPKKRAKS